MPKPSSERIKANFSLQGGRPQQRTTPDPSLDTELSSGPGKRADERVISVPVDEILPDRYQGRLRWSINLDDLERLYTGEWDAQDVLTAIDRTRKRGNHPALDNAWQATLELAQSILSEGQVAPITVYMERDLPTGYRYIIETGEGRYWSYQLIRWLLKNNPDVLDVPREEWREDPHYIRAVAISQPSRLRQVAENEQRQSYPSAVDRAIAYASMLAENMNWEVRGSPPGIRNGQLELPEAYRRAAKRGLRGQKNVVQQVPTGEEQIQRHLRLLNELDAVVLARAKENALTESQLRKLTSQPVEVQRMLIEEIIEKNLSSRQIEAQLQEEEDIPAITFDENQEQDTSGTRGKEPLTIVEESSRLLRMVTRVASRYDALHKQASDAELMLFIEAELEGYDNSARGSQRANTPRQRLKRLKAFLDKIAD